MLKSFDGRVFYREWTCVSPKAVIIFVHGMGGYSGRFFEMGPYFAKAGFQIFAIEQKGHGESPSIKGHISNFKLYSSDLKSLVEHARAQFPGRKIFVFGESMGGLITLDFCIHFQDLIDGIILVSPAVKDKLPMSLKKKAEILKAAIFDPMGFFPAGFSASMFTRDPLIIKRIDADELETRNFTAKFFLSILKAIIYVNSKPRAIKLPVLMLLSGKDTMVSAEAAAAYFKKIRSKDKELKLYPEMYHALYVDKDRIDVFKDIIDWTSRHI